MFKNFCTSFFEIFDDYMKIMRYFIKVSLKTCTNYAIFKVYTLTNNFIYILYYIKITHKLYI